MVAIIIGTSSLVVICRVLWLCSHGTENQLLSNHAPYPQDLEASDVITYVVELG